MRKFNKSGFNPRNGKNRAGFTRESCIKGGSVCRGYETEEDARKRALIDARGLVLAEGMSYRAEYPDGKPWQKRRAVSGRVAQVEVLFDGKVVLRTGESKLRGPWKFLSKRTISLAKLNTF